MQSLMPVTIISAGGSGPVARQSHKLEDAGSNPAPATRIRGPKTSGYRCRMPLADTCPRVNGRPALIMALPEWAGRLTNRDARHFFTPMQLKKQNWKKLRNEFPCRCCGKAHETKVCVEASGRKRFVVRPESPYPYNPFQSHRDL
jgi:hypothetical protein